MKLRSKILVYSLPLFLIPFLLTALAAYFLVVRTYEAREKDQFERRLNDSVSQIRIDFQTAIARNALLADSPELSRFLQARNNGIENPNELNEIRLFFERLKSRDPNIIQIGVIGKKGDEVLKISEFEFKQQDREALLQSAFKRTSILGNSQTPVFELKDGRTATSFMNSVGQDEFLGALFLIVDTRAFQSPLRSAAVQGASIVGFDDRGVVWARLAPSGSGILLTDTFVETVRSGPDPNLESLDPIPLGNSGENASIVPVLTFRRMEQFEPIPGERWFLGVIQSRTVPPGLRVFQGVLLTIVILTAAAVIWLSAAGAGKITRPIEQVSRATANIAKGEHQLDLDVRTGDEVEDLARSVTKMNIELQEYQKQIIESARLAAMGEMTSEISHEIQNRISGVSLWLQHLDAEVDQDDERREYIEEMKLGLAGFIDMLAGLKDYYRKPRLEKSDFDFGVMQNEALASVEEAAAKKRIEFKFESSDIEIKGDREKLKSVVLNLLINAVDASPDGGKISIRTSIDESDFELHVEDQGAGIPESELQKVFYPFYTTKSSGSGLGLAISKNIVEAHGGSLKAEKTGRDGTGFCVRIPLGI